MNLFATAAGRRINGVARFLCGMNNRAGGMATCDVWATLCVTTTPFLDIFIFHFAANEIWQQHLSTIAAPPLKRRRHMRHHGAAFYVRL